jgi:4-hydroxybenzoate polyprenyltransferase
LPLAPTAAWDVLAALAFARAAGGLGLGGVAPLEWVALAATSLALYGAGMAANDLADRERDRVLAPDRPLPSGALKPGPVAALVAILLAAALALGGGAAGDRRVVGLAALAAMLYDAGGKRSVVGGALLMGTVRTANAAIAVVPLAEAGLVPWWTLLGCSSVGLASAAITVLSTTEDVFAPRRVVLARVLTAVAYGAAGALSALAAGALTLGVVLGAMVVSSVAFGRRPKPGPVKRQVLEMLLGLYVLSACLASAAEGGGWAVGLVVLVVAWGLGVASQLLVRALRPSS